MNFLYALFGKKRESTTNGTDKSSSSVKVMKAQPVESINQIKSVEQKIEQVKKELKTWYKACSMGQVGHGICDDCSSPLEPGKAYRRSGGYLCCESCTDAFLDATYIDWDESLKDINRAFGPGISDRIVQLSRQNVDQSKPT